MFDGHRDTRAEVRRVSNSPDQSPEGPDESPAVRPGADDVVDGRSAAHREDRRQEVVERTARATDDLDGSSSAAAGDRSNASEVMIESGTSDEPAPTGAVQEQSDADHLDSHQGGSGQIDEALARAVDPPTGHSLGRNMSMLLLSQIATWSISLTLLVLEPRFLGAEAIGRFQITAAVWAIAGAFAAFGTDAVITLSIARDRSSAQAVIGPAILGRTALFAITSIAVAIVVGLGFGREWAIVFVLLGLGAFALNLAAVAEEALRGFEDLVLPSRATIIFKFVGAGTVIIALLLGGDIVAVAAINAAASFLYTFVLFRYLGRYTSLRFRWSAREAIEVLRRGIPFFLGGLIVIVYLELDSIVIAVLIDEVQVGWYAAADRLLASSLFIPTAVMSALLPVLARVGEDDPDEARLLAGQGFRTLLLFSLPIGVGLAIISSSLARLLFGSEFAESGPVLAAFAFVLMIMFQTILLGQYAIAVGREKFFFSLLAIAVVASVPLDLLLVTWTSNEYDNGAIGGALAYIVTEGFVLIVATVVLVPDVLDRRLVVRIVKCVLAAGVMAAAVWPLRNAFPLVPIAVGGVVYGVALLALRTLDDREQRLVGGVVWRITRGRHGEESELSL